MGYTIYQRVFQGYVIAAIVRVQYFIPFPNFLSTPFETIVFCREFPHSIGIILNGGVSRYGDGISRSATVHPVQRQVVVDGPLFSYYSPVLDLWWFHEAWSSCDGGATRWCPKKIVSVQLGFTELQFHELVYG